MILYGCAKTSPDTAVPLDPKPEEISVPASPLESFSYFEGEVMVILPGESEWTVVESGTVLEEGSTVRTGPDSFARIYLDADKQIDMDEETSFEVKSKGEETSIEMFYGALRARISGIDREKMDIHTPVAVASVRGTDFAVIYEKEGLCEVEVYGGSILLAAVPAEEAYFPPVEVSENFAASARLAEAPVIIGEITDTRQLRWIHFDERMQSFLNLRRLRAVEAYLRRQRGLLRAAPAEEQGPIREKIGRLRTEQAALEREKEARSEILEEIRLRYSGIRQEQAERRRLIIEQQRKEIIEQRLKRIEEERQRRRRELEEK